jgi:hypothetical protein
MYYEDDGRGGGILGGFTLGMVFGAGIGLLLMSSRSLSGDAVRRARALKGATGRKLRTARGGAASRVARRRFTL